MMTVRIEPLTSLPNPDWLRMRLALWPDTSAAEHPEEVRLILTDPGRFGQFIAVAENGEALGFAEVALRSDYVNGTTSSPVGFLEGLYVEPAARRQGVARALLDAVVAWAKDRGCRELASDTDLENRASQSVHTRLGFVETERVVYFRRELT